METGISGGKLIDNGVEKTAAGYFTVSTSRLEVTKKNAGETVKAGEITNTIMMPSPNPNQEAGAIRIQKEIEGNAWPQETYPKFDFKATWTDGNGKHEVELSLTPDKETQAAVSGQIIVPLGTEITVTEAPVSGWTPNYATGGAKVTVTATETEKTVTIKNTYAASGEWKPEGITKLLNGEVLAEDQFTFVVKEDEKTVSTGTNKANGTVEFTPISYTEEGTHTYTITEVAKDGYYAEPNTIHVTVTVRDNADGTLQTSAQYGQNTNMTFTNYKLQKLTIEKVVDWQGTTASDQTFNLAYSYTKPGDTVTNGVIEAKYNAENGNITYTSGNVIDVPHGVEVKVTENVNTAVWTPTYHGYDAGKDFVTVDGEKTVKVTNTRRLYNNDGILNVTKVWKDAEDKTLAAPLPSSLTVGLFVNDATVPVQTIELTGNTWTGRFTNLPATDMNGEPINYTVKELGQNGSYVEAGAIATLQATNGENYEYTFAAQVNSGTATLTNALKDKGAQVPDKEGPTEGVQPGDSVPFTIKATNNLASAANVVIKDTLVKGLSFEDATVQVNGVAATSAELKKTINADGSTTCEWTISDVPPMGEVIVQLNAKLTVDAITIDSLTNTATAKVGDQQEMRSAAVTVKHPKLTITKTASPATEVKPGETIIYTLKVINSGEADAADVVVTDTLPDEVTYVNGADTAISVSGQTVTWNAGTVAANGEQSISFTVKVKDDSELHNATTITNVARITSVNNIPDPNGPYDDTVNQIARIKTEKNARIANGKTVASVGDIVTYTIQVTNNGGVKLTNVVVADAMFEQAEANTLKLNDAPVTLVGGVVSVGDLDVGAIATITYDYKVRESDLFRTNAEIHNTARATGETPNDKEVTDDANATVTTDGANGSMTITKNVNDTTNDKNNDLAFLFTVSGEGISDGDRTFALKNGESKTISGLGIGAAYTVTETGVEGMGANALHAWDTTIHGEQKVSTTVTIVAQSDNRVDVTNTRKLLQPSNGTLTVQKLWKNGDTTNDTLAASLIPASVQVTLSGSTSSGQAANLGDTTRMLNQGNNWQTTYNNLPATDLLGNPYTYTAEEVGENEGKVTYTANDGKAYTYDVTYDENTITNTLANNTPTPTTKDANRAIVEIDDTIVYTITRTSHLNQTTSATITDTLPEGLTYVSSKVNGVETAPDRAGQQLT